MKIQDEYTSTLPPVNLDESVPGTPKPLPLTIVCQYSFVLHCLTPAIAHTMDLCQSTTPARRDYWPRCTPLPAST